VFVIPAGGLQTNRVLRETFVKIPLAIQSAIPLFCLIRFLFVHPAKRSLTIVRFLKNEKSEVTRLQTKIAELKESTDLPIYGCHTPFSLSIVRYPLILVPADGHFSLAKFFSFFFILYGGFGTAQFLSNLDPTAVLSLNTLPMYLLQLGNCTMPYVCVHLRT
jgi:hypothetical protein